MQCPINVRRHASRGGISGNLMKQPKVINSAWHRREIYVIKYK